MFLHLHFPSQHKRTISAATKSVFRGPVSSREYISYSQFFIYTRILPYNSIYTTTIPQSRSISGTIVYIYLLFRARKQNLSISGKNVRQQTQTHSPSCLTYYNEEEYSCPGG